MDRATTVAAIDWIRKTVRPTLPHLSRGWIQLDSAELSGYPDLSFVGTAMGFKVLRDEGLADGKHQYYNQSDHSLLASD
jgi:hypothetical protein